MGVKFCILWFILVLLMAFLPGCSSAKGDAARHDGWAASIAGAAKLGTPKPDPAPTPKPGGMCANCNGTGRVGDGVISSTCLDCGGTGVICDTKPDDNDPNDTKPTPPPTCTADSCQAPQKKPTNRHRLFWRLRRR